MLGDSTIPDPRSSALIFGPTFSTLLKLISELRLLTKVFFTSVLIAITICLLLNFIR